MKSTFLTRFASLLALAVVFQFSACSGDDGLAISSKKLDANLTRVASDLAPAGYYGAPWSQANFRGNAGGATGWLSVNAVAMIPVPGSPGVFKTPVGGVTFKPTDGDGPPRFKIDRGIDWKEALPAEDYIVNFGSNGFPNRTYDITFDSVKHKITVKDTGSNDLMIHFKKPVSWKDANIYAWVLDSVTGEVVPLAGIWSGKRMNDEGCGWYSWIIDGYAGKSVNVVFNDGDKNQTLDLVCNPPMLGSEMWYTDGVWSDKDPKFKVGWEKIGSSKHYVYAWTTSGDGKVEEICGPWPGALMTMVNYGPGKDYAEYEFCGGGVNLVFSNALTKTIDLYRDKQGYYVSNAWQPNP